MNSLIRLFKNPYSLIFAAAHWGLVLILYLENKTRTPSPVSFGGEVHDTWQDALSILLVVVNLPAILFSALLWLPAYITNHWELFWFGTIFTGILTVTFQWLIVGKIVFNIFSPVESRMTTLSLKDK